MGITLYDYCRGSDKPELLAQWHSAKNGETSPRTISHGSKKKVWWICGKGHEWEATVLSRAHGAGCPVCSGKAVLPGENDMASMYPQVAAQWHSAKNGSLRPDAQGPSPTARSGGCAGTGMSTGRA